MPSAQSHYGSKSETFLLARKVFVTLKTSNRVSELILVQIVRKTFAVGLGVERDLDEPCYEPLYQSLRCLSFLFRPGFVAVSSSCSFSYRLRVDYFIE